MKAIQSFNWKKNIILFLVSQCTTLFGSTIVQMAIIWYVTMKTSSGAWVAAFTICSHMPQFLVSFVGGVWADRYDRKKLIIGSDAVIAAVTLVMMLSIPSISSDPTLLCALLLVSVIRSLGAGVQTPAVNAVIPQLVPKEQLMRYNGINATMQSIVQFAAPAAAGAIFTVSTLQSIMIVDIITAAIGISLFSCVLLPQQNILQEKVALLTDMKVGVKYAFSNKIIRNLLMVYGLYTFLCVPAGFLAGLLVRRVYGDTYWYLTVVELVGFAGMMIGGLVVSTSNGFNNHIKTLFISLFTFGLFTIGIGISDNFILYLVLMLFYGVAMTIVQTSITTLIQEKTEVPMQGRILGLLSSMYSGFLPIGMATFGPLADVISLKLIIIGSGVALVLIATTICCNCHFTDK